MKKLKIVMFSILTVVMLATCVLFVGCRTNGGHEHTYDDATWQSDETYHWHAATCEHKEEVKDKAEHSWDDGTVTKQPTTSATGVKTYTCTVCAKTKEETIPKEEVVIKLNSISVNATGAKTTYDLDEDFSYEGIKVSIVKKNNATDELLPAEEISVADCIADGSLVVDSSRFKKGVAGEYTIRVNYTFESVRKTGNYVVTVKKSAGMAMEKEATEYEFVSGGVVINVDDITIHMAGANGIRGEALTANQYTLTYFKGEDEVAPTDGQFKVNEAGIYQIWAEVKGYTIPGSDEKVDVKNFVLVYVNDQLESIAIKSGEGVFTQDKGITDEMSSTWKFILTYKSGATKEIASNAEGLDISGIVPETVTEEGKATVTYTETNAKGEEKTVTAEVAYKITEPQAVGPVVNNYALDLTAYNANADKLELDDTTLVGNNAFLKRFNAPAGDDRNFAAVARTNENKVTDLADAVCESIEFKYEALGVNFLGTGTLKVTFCSTGGSNNSDFALIGLDGNYVVPANAAAVEANKTADGVYKVLGTKANAITLEYNITEAGTYTFSSAIDDANCGRNTRILAIEMTDKVGGQPTYEENNYALDLTAFAGSTDKDVLTQASLTGNNAFITLNDVENTKPNIRVNNAGEPYAIEIKGEGMIVKFLGTGTISVTFSSTGGSNTSDFALKGANGYLVAANDSAIPAGNKESEGIYNVTGTTATAITLTYEITEAGDYTLCTNVTPSGLNDGKGKYNRASRILAIEMTDKVGEQPTPSTEAHSYALSLAAYNANADKLELNDTTLTGANAFLKRFNAAAGDDRNFAAVARTNENKVSTLAEAVCESIEFKYEALGVTFLGTGTIKITFCSTGGSNNSDFALIGLDGKYLIPTNAAAVEANKTADGVYKVLGTKANAITLEYSITEAGTYTFSSAIDGANCGRNTRVLAIEMTDSY